MIDSVTLSETVDGAFSYDAPSSVTPSEAVITTLATITGAATVDYDGRDPSIPVLDPLYDAIDPDALDSLFVSDDPGVNVSFTTNGYRVTVHSGPEITVSVRDAGE